MVTGQDIETELTCWRGMQIEHPSEWELVIASGYDMPGEMTFADRLHQRLDVQWRSLNYVPNLELMLDKFRRQEKKKSHPEPLEGAPHPWRGVIRKIKSGGMLIHAGRFFKNTRQFVEVTVFWPGARDAKLERSILESTMPAEAVSSVRSWRAMGIHLDVPEEFDVRSTTTSVGRISWSLRAQDKRRGTLTVERIAMANQWLAEPLRQWLAEQLPEGSSVRRRDTRQFNAHSGEVLISTIKTATLTRLRGLRGVRLDAAWLCPIEDRVYHVVFEQIRRDENIALPQSLVLHCCRPVPNVKKQGHI